MKKLKILGEDVDVKDDYIDINECRFLKDNPRVYTVTHGEPGFDNKHEEQQQEIIYEKLLEEPSVSNLIPEIKRHGGLMESILIRLDTMEVIEGNSRLAVYRKLYKDTGSGDWEFIPCDTVSSLTDKQQATFLNQIHVKGKTNWSAYEKANFAYVRRSRGWSFQDISKLFGESDGTIRRRVKAIEMMKENDDQNYQNFSYYEVLYNNKDIQNEMEKIDGYEDLLLDIKRGAENGEPDCFSAQDLRNKLPVVLKKTKILKQYVAKKITLDEAFQRAKISHIEENVRQAYSLLEDVSKAKVQELEQSRFNAFKQDVKKLSRQTDRIKKMMNEVDGHV